jgi:hypothetical protein
MFYLLATTPAKIPKGYTMSLSVNFHQVVKIEVVASNTSIPALDLVIHYKNFRGDKVRTQVIDIFCDTYADLENVYVQMSNEVISALIIEKLNPNNNANATE